MDDQVEAGGSFLCLCTEVSVLQVIWPPRGTECAKDVDMSPAQRPTENSDSHEGVFKFSDTDFFGLCFNLNIFFRW